MSVFKPGDVAYLPSFGAVEIASSKYNGTYSWTQRCGESGDAREECLSFSPWPKPNHERPLEDGLYLVTYGGSIQFLGVYKHSTWHWADGGIKDWKGRACSNQPAVTIVKFLHALPKN